MKFHGRRYRLQENSLDFIEHSGIALQQAVAFPVNARKVADMPFVSLARPV
jgi:hypothetical protein